MRRVVELLFFFVRRTMKRYIKINIQAVALFILLIMFISSTAYIIFKAVERKINENSTPMKDMLESIEIDLGKMESEENEEKQTKRQLQLKELKKQNEDIVACIEIENTNISYPVVQGADNDYYVTHDYLKQESKDGALFLDASCDFRIPSTNLIIYGHNNQNGKMFSTLEKYKNESYYKEHPTIRFTTLEEDEAYEIIAAFYSRVYYTHENNVFKYYFFINSINEEQFNDYINNSKKASIYDTGKTAKYGEQLLTLSTCSYHIEDGRFVVVARKK